MRISLFSFLLFISIKVSSQTFPPCWFNNPVNQQQIGFIGAASPFSVQANGSLIASRKKAVKKLFDYYDIEINQREFDFTASHIALNQNMTIIFSTPYTDHQAMYSYASLAKKSSEKVLQQNWLTQTCPIQACDFNQCSPSWLCNGNENHIISVSPATSMPANQLSKTYDNAQTLLQYIAKSKVDDFNYQVESKGKFQQWGYREHKGLIQALAPKNKLINTHSCQTSNYMFARYRYQDNKTSRNLKTNKVTKPFAKWVKEPNLTDTIGAVGIFSGISADGLFSTAIKHAIKEGLLELAKIKHIDIDHSYQISNNKGLYSLAKTTMTTSAVVTAKLQDIKIIEEKNQLVIYTWLLETKTTK